MRSNFAFAAAMLFLIIIAAVLLTFGSDWLWPAPPP
jgi:hypothetical protein